MWSTAAVGRVCNFFFETLYFSCPRLRMEPSHDHALKATKELTPLERINTGALVRNDRLALVGRCLGVMGLFYAMPRHDQSSETGPTTSCGSILLLLGGNHLIASSSGMLMCQALMMFPGSRESILSHRSRGKHPVSRNTCQDHWLEHVAIVPIGSIFGQILAPLEFRSFGFLLLLRAAQQAERQSGVSFCSTLVSRLGSQIGLGDFCNVFFGLPPPRQGRKAQHLEDIETTRSLAEQHIEQSGSLLWPLSAVLAACIFHFRRVL